MLQIKAAEVDQKLRLEEQASRQHQRDDIDALLAHFDDNDFFVYFRHKKTSVLYLWAQAQATEVSLTYSCGSASAF